MKFNKWTLGLAALGVVSLASVVQAEERTNPVLTAAAPPMLTEETPMALRDFKVLTFDVVGTLIDFEGGMLAYLRQAVPAAACDR